MTAVAALAARGADSLLAEFASGSGPGAGEAAFAEVVRRYAAAVFATCLRVTKNAHDADDATQVTFLTLALQAKAGKPIAKLAPWLQRVAQRAALDVRRGRRRREAHERRHAEARRREVDLHHRDFGRGAGAGAGTVAALASRNGAAGVDVERLGEVMAEELAKLPAKYRLPLASLYCADLTRAQIAEELDLSPHALRLRIHRGRKMLAERLSARGVGPVERLLKGSLLATALVAVARQAMVARAAGAANAAGATGAAGATALGTDLVAATTARVLAAVNASLAATVVAKLKGVAGIVLLLGVSAVAAGSAAAANWPAIEGRLPPAVRQLIDAVKSTIHSPGRPALPRPSQPRFGPTPMARANADPVLSPSRPMLPLTPPLTARNRPPDPPAPAAAPRQAVATAARASVPAPAVVPAPRRSGSGGAGPRTTVVAVAPTPARARAESAVVNGPGFALAPPVHGGAGASPGMADRAGQSLDVDSGTYTFRGGTLSVDELDVGRTSQGQFIHDGGAVWTSRLQLGADAGGRGDYNLVSGSLVIAQPFDHPPAPRGGVYGGGVHVGGAGDGALHLGGGNSPGGLVVQPRGPDSPHPLPTPGRSQVPANLPPTVVVRGDAGGSGLIEGWGGMIGDGGAFVNNGQVIADGGGRGRELVLLGYGAVTSTVENNPAGGSNGWYARNMGRLLLPKISVAPGTGTYTWGEDAADPTIDLVNSVRLTLHDVAKAGLMQVSLLSKDNSEVPKLPTAHTFIGVWKFDAGSLEHGDVDLVVRYDDGLAHELHLNENILKLWRYQDGEWIRMDHDASFWRDAGQHLLGVTVPAGNFDYFAVSAPEPATFCVVGVGGALALLRRPRRRAAR